MQIRSPHNTNPAGFSDDRRRNTIDDDSIADEALDDSGGAAAGPEATGEHTLPPNEVDSLDELEDSDELEYSDELGGSIDVSLGSANTLLDDEESDDEYDISSELSKNRIKARLFRKPSSALRVDHFIVLEEIGSGAMGDVYAAYDEKLDRKVALKLVRPEVAARSRHASDRLLREARTLARLSHPNVVQVYEVGQFHGRVFLAMEFIRGASLSEWLEEQRALPERKRWQVVLDAMRAAASGLQAAHKADLAHRDFKPDNVLVGDDGRVYVADFGLARTVEPASNGPGGEREAASSSARDAVTLDPDRPRGWDGGVRSAPMPERWQAPVRTERPWVTAHGVLIGTPAYMSPEQFQGRVADARSDQYSFCVALHEALYGERPCAGEDFDALKANVLTGTLRPVPRTSLVPAAVARVIARGLAVDPDERYESMEQLLDALSRAVARRRRLAGMGGAMGLVAVVAVGLAMTVGGARPAPCEHAGRDTAALWTPAVQERMRAAFAGTGLPYADAMFTRAAERLSGYTEALALERVHTCEATRVRGEQSEEVFTLATVCLDRREEAVRATVERLVEADALTVEKSPRVLAGLPSASGCRDREALVLGPRPPGDPAVAAKVRAIRAALAEADVQWQSGHLHEAEELAMVQLREAEALDYPLVRAQALLVLARVWHDADTPAQIDKAENTLLKVADIAEAGRDDELMVITWLELVVLAVRHHDTFEIGHIFARRAVAVSERLGDPAYRARALSKRGLILYRDHAFAEAEDYQRRALKLLGDANLSPINVALVWHGLGLALASQRGRSHEAEDAYQHAAALFLDELGPLNDYLAGVWLDHGSLLRQRGDYAGARKQLEHARDAFVEIHGSSHIRVANAIIALANVAQSEGRLELAERHANDARDLYQRSLPAGSARHARPEILLAIIQFRRHRFADAADSFRRALDLQRLLLGEHHLETAETHSNLAETLVQLGQCDLAQGHLDLADAARQLNPSGHSRLAEWIARGRGMAHLCLGNHILAEQWLSRALEAMREHEGDPLERAGVMWGLARARRANGKWPDAETRGLAEQARALFSEGGQAGAIEFREIGTFLNALPDNSR